MQVLLELHLTVIIRNLKVAKDLGADGGYLSLPAYTKPTQEGMLAHFSKILGSVDFPIIIYNSAQRSGVELAPEIVTELANEFSNFAAIKEQSISNTLKIKHLIGDKIPLICEDWLFLSSWVLGVTGVQTVVGSLFPRMVVEMYENLMKVKLEEARRTQIQLYPLMEILGIGTGGRESNPAPLKAAMAMLGMPAGNPRLPLAPANEETKKRLETILPKLVPSMKIAVN